MKSTIPATIAPFLWSYDLAKLDLKRDKRRIITNVLNFGTQEATDWLFATYAKEDIKEAIVNPIPGEWNRRSLHFWALVFGVKPGDATRRIA